jgi:copper chaperone
MKKIILHIPDMQSAHCRSRVQNVLSALPELKIDSLQPGTVTLLVESELVAEEAILEIGNAGYEVRSMTRKKPAEETLLFKTNINCTGCVSKVTPFLNDAEGICHWEVDTVAADKILSVHSQGITASEVISQVRKAGFTIEPITENQPSAS